MTDTKLFKIVNSSFGPLSHRERTIEAASMLGWRDPFAATRLLDQLDVGQTLPDDDNDTWERTQ
ncbi:hypothetical protein [Xanthomonas phage pXoo2107]|nr:hypothetical protein [Xanthomonas phage pXoo2107]